MSFLQRMLTKAEQLGLFGSGSRAITSNPHNHLGVDSVGRVHWLAVGRQLATHEKTLEEHMRDESIPEGEQKRLMATRKESRWWSDPATNSTIMSPYLKYAQKHFDAVRDAISAGDIVPARALKHYSHLKQYARDNALRKPGEHLATGLARLDIEGHRVNRAVEREREQLHLGKFAREGDALHMRRHKDPRAARRGEIQLFNPATGRTQDYVHESHARHDFAEQVEMPLTKAEQLALFGTIKTNPKNTLSVDKVGRVHWIKNAGVTTFASGSSRPAEFRGFMNANHPVGVEISEVSGPIEDLIAAYTGKDGRVFVDSGAFPAFRRNEPVDWDKVWQRYDRLLAKVENKGGLYMVMPDVVGSQAQTLILQERYAHRIREFIGQGVHVLIPIQKGEFTPADVFGHLVGILKTRNFAVAVPSNEAAFDAADLATLLTAKPQGIHFLGIASGAKLAPLIEQVRAAAPEASVTTDANLVRGWVGKNRPFTRNIAARTSDEVAAAFNGEGRHPHWDETELPVAAATPGFLTQRQIEAFASKIGLPVDEVRQSIRTGTFGELVGSFGDWGFQALNAAVTPAAEREIRPVVRSEEITRKLNNSPHVPDAVWNANHESKMLEASHRRQIAAGETDAQRARRESGVHLGKLQREGRDVKFPLFEYGRKRTTDMSGATVPIPSLDDVYQAFRRNDGDRKRAHADLASRFPYGVDSYEWRHRFEAIAASHAKPTVSEHDAALARYPMDRARAIMGDAYEACIPHANELLRSLKEVGLPPAAAHEGGVRAGAPLLVTIANENLRKAPSAKIQRDIDRLNGGIAASLARSQGTYGFKHGGDSAAHARELDRKRIERLQAELDRRALSKAIKPSLERSAA